MLVYTVYEPPAPAPTLDLRADSLVFVKEGFSMPAFLLGPIWLATHRLWLGLMLYIAAVLALLGLFQILPGGNSAVGGVLALASFAFSLEASAIRHWGLVRRGYHMIGAAAGATFEDCEHRFFTGWLAGQRPDALRPTDPSQSLSSGASLPMPT